MSKAFDFPVSKRLVFMTALSLPVTVNLVPAPALTTEIVGFVEKGGSYSIISVPGSVNTEPISINNSGAIAGTYVIGSSIAGFEYSHGIYTEIYVPGSVPINILSFYEGSTIPVAINSGGAITGYYSAGHVPNSSANEIFGFVYSAGTYTTIEFPGSVYTVPTGINNAGVVTGYYGPTGVGPHCSVS